MRECISFIFTERGVPEQLKPEIVKIHNELRRQNALGKVAGQPKASNMLKLVSKLVIPFKITYYIIIFLILDVG